MLISESESLRPAYAALTRSVRVNLRIYNNCWNFSVRICTRLLQIFNLALCSLFNFAILGFRYGRILKLPNSQLWHDTPSPPTIVVADIGHLSLFLSAVARYIAEMIGSREGTCMMAPILSLHSRLIVDHSFQTVDIKRASEENCS